MGISKCRFQPASSQIPCLARICNHEPFWHASSFFQWFVQWHCSSKAPRVQIEKCSKYANHGSNAEANRAIVPGQSGIGFVQNDDPAIVSREHVPLFPGAGIDCNRGIIIIIISPCFYSSGKIETRKSCHGMVRHGHKCCGEFFRRDRNDGFTIVFHDDSSRLEYPDECVDVVANGDAKI